VARPVPVTGVVQNEMLPDEVAEQGGARVR
jgi:hypothetical protein